MPSSNIPFWLSRSEVREVDRLAVNEFGVPSVVLMENAGRGVAVLMRRLNPEKKRVTILCGPGNNGGDGFVIARHLENHGWPVHVFLFDRTHESSPDGTGQGGTVFMGYSPERLPPDARLNFEIVRKAGIESSAVQGELWPATRNWLSNAIVTEEGWLVDALFGTGLDRPLSAPFDEVAAMMNASENPVLAVDIPSGLDCDTGEPLGTTVRATHTATFVAWKKGFLEPSAESWIGTVHVVDIGAPKKLVDRFRSSRSKG